MKLYGRRMQIEQNFRDEKNERFGFGLRASHSGTAAQRHSRTLFGAESVGNPGNGGVMAVELSC